MVGSQKPYIGEMPKGFLNDKKLSDLVQFLINTTSILPVTLQALALFKAQTSVHFSQTCFFERQPEAESRALAELAAD